MRRVDVPMTQAEAMTLWGVLDKLVAYGLTEAGATITLSRDEHAELTWIANRVSHIVRDQPPTIEVSQLHKAKMLDVDRLALDRQLSAEATPKGRRK
jgi:hypothetical protein